MWCLCFKGHSIIDPDSEGGCQSVPFISQVGANVNHGVKEETGRKRTGKEGGEGKKGREGREGREDKKRGGRKETGRKLRKGRRT